MRQTLAIKRLFRDPRAAVGVGVVAVLISWLIARDKGAAGIGLGIGATVFSILALWWVIRVVARPLDAPAEARGRTLFILFCFALKVPILGGAWWLAQRLGDPAPGHFLAGLFLVYFALVGWAIARGEPS